MDSILKKLIKAEWVDELPPDDPLHWEGKDSGNLITSLVLTLIRAVPNYRVNRLGEMMFDLIGQKIIPAAVMSVDRMAFMAERRNGKETGVILVPPDFPDRVKENFVYCLGGMAFVGSQAVDCYNGRLIPPPLVAKRGWAYEATVLLEARKVGCLDDPNEYQEKILEEYPKGIDSVDCWYDYKEEIEGPPSELCPPRRGMN